MSKRIGSLMPGLFILLVAALGAAARPCSKRVGQYRGDGDRPVRVRASWAKVTATNEGTEVKTNTETNYTGAYRFPFLPIGIYTIRVEAPGFQSLVREGITLRVDEVARVDASMIVGSVKDEVTITGRRRC